MKNLLYSLICVTLFSNCFSKKKVVPQCTDTNKIEGYFVVKFIKSEVEFSLENETLRKENKTHARLIDFDKESFFLQIDSNASLVEAIKNWNSFSQKNVYYLPFNQRMKCYFNEFCSDDNLNVIFSDLSKMDNTKFYMMEGDETHLYKIYHIIGYEKVLILENNELNKFKLGLALADDIDKNEKTFNAHFVYEIISIQSNKDINRFKIWEMCSSNK